MGHLARAGIAALLIFASQEKTATPVQTMPGGITYEQFLRLAERERESRFREASPQVKAMLKRTHAERWLVARRQELADSQAALVQEAIAFIRPELYQMPESQELRRAEENLKKRLTCNLGRRRVTAAFTFWDQTTRQSWSDAIDEWLSWFADCHPEK